MRWDVASVYMKLKNYLLLCGIDCIKNWQRHMERLSKNQYEIMKYEVQRKLHEDGMIPFYLGRMERMRETYKVKRPHRIVRGDPWYWEEYAGEKLQSLIVDFQTPKYCDARVVLEEQPMEKFPNMMINTMTIYLAPKQTIETYMQGMMFESQQHIEKGIGVDTAKYYFQVDDKNDTIHTGGDGYWGSYQSKYDWMVEQNRERSE